MTKTEILTELMGDSISDFVADELRETYYSLTEHLNSVITNKNVEDAPIWSYDKDEEIKKTKKMIKAVKQTHKWFSTKKL